ncbi:MAG TPA: F0F1 ATP synthase subunit A [Candidatus Binatia bacterium]|nr:F0F1 ATP synthase subunit A [Candidatus Binatia bacterium]
MTGLLLGDATPGQHPLLVLCGNPNNPPLYCQLNYDTLISSAIAIAVTLAIGFVLAGTVRLGKPTKLQMAFELFLGYVRNLVRETVGQDAPSFVLPLAATIGFFILTANWLDFFPLEQPVEPANADLNLTLAMGLVVFILSQAYSIRIRGLGGYLHHFTRPYQLNVLVRVLFTVLNIIEEVVKPITLALRLFGNLFAAVVMAYLLGGLFAALVGGSAVTAALSPLAILALVVWKLFDVLLIGTIQAFIFMLLTIIYFGQAREGMESSEHSVEDATERLASTLSDTHPASQVDRRASGYQTMQ